MEFSDFLVLASGLGSFLTYVIASKENGRFTLGAIITMVLLSFTMVGGLIANINKNAEEKENLHKIISSISRAVNDIQPLDGSVKLQYPASALPWIKPDTLEDIGASFLKRVASYRKFSAIIPFGFKLVLCDSAHYFRAVQSRSLLTKSAPFYAEFVDDVFDLHAGKDSIQLSRSDISAYVWKNDGSIVSSSDLPGKYLLLQVLSSSDTSDVTVRRLLESKPKVHLYLDTRHMNIYIPHDSLKVIRPGLFGTRLPDDLKNILQ